MYSLRPSLLPGLVDSVSHNRRHGQRDVRLFELGTRFVATSGERRALGLAWMGALDDNLEFLAKGDGGGAGEWGRAATNELIRSKIKIKSMNFMRGRTFLNKYVIIDEAQNLTPKQMKTLVTRAGPGTKIICMGNLAQIDTPYLTEGSSGLTFAVDKFKGWPHSGHITLARGERSRLADFASDVL